MARSIIQKPNTDAPDSDYIYGRIRDDSGADDGTPVNEEVYGDFHQFFIRLLDKAGIVPNGLPDNAYSGFQLFDAIKGDQPIVYDTYARYWRAAGRVYIQGAIGSGQAVVTSGGTEFTLPAGFRPAVLETFYLMYWDVGVIQGIGALTINTNGVVNFSAFTGAGTARRAVVEGISFPIA